jgi:CRP/FNR family transcriptional regulator, cyclic AMP receptor protein
MNSAELKTRSYEDPLDHLTQRPVQQYAKGQVIYSATNPSSGLHLVILGRVKINSTHRGGYETLNRIVYKEGLFGESSLLPGNDLEEMAIALENATIMSWTTEEIERQIERDPRLGVALVQYLVQNCLDMQHRVQGLVAYKTPERVMVALLQLAEAGGEKLPDGMCRLAALTHRDIANYVATSREIVTSHLNVLRRSGMIRYSRQYIDIDVARLDRAVGGLMRPPGGGRLEKRPILPYFKTKTGNGQELGVGPVLQAGPDNGFPCTVAKPDDRSQLVDEKVHPA